MSYGTKKKSMIFPNHGSQVMGKGLENKILKEAGIKNSVIAKKKKNEH